jgi:predicted DCC family thiol-disulfide oxidoreductase YuxK
MATATAPPTAPVTQPLPTPAERPEADVVIYDGECGICTSQVQRLPWWDAGMRLSYLSLHDPEVARRWPDLPHDRMMQEIVIVDQQGRRHWGPSAIRYLSRRLPRMWWAVPVLFFPGSMLLWRPAYRWIARNRYWLSGGAKCEDGMCDLHR